MFIKDYKRDELSDSDSILAGVALLIVVAALVAVLFVISNRENEEVNLHNQDVITETDDTPYSCNSEEN